MNTQKILLALLLFGGFLLSVYFAVIIYQKAVSKINLEKNNQIYNMNINELDNKVANGELQKAVFSGGCFWCTEASFDPEYGVETAVSGFFGGTTQNPTYENHGDHREGVIIYFNNASTSYKKLLVNYWKHIDPTQENGQFADTGSSYRTAIYYFNEEQKILAEQSRQILIDSKKFANVNNGKIAVEILDGMSFQFYPVEEYHQDYAAKNPTRYEYYKNGSGRSDFVHKYWDNDTTFENFLTEAGATPPLLKGGWGDFTKEIKEARLK